MNNTPAEFHLGHHHLHGLYQAPRKERDLRGAVFALLVIAAFIAGLLLGQSSDPTPRHSRIEWPTKATLFP
jgi:hypothetical protein